MHIKFEHIDIEGFMSIEKGSLDLNNQGYVLINGINNNPTDASKSNGSGKSSIIEAIVYALTGETIRGTKDIVNRMSSNGCKITLDFKVDNTSYKIIRTKDYDVSGSNLKLYVDNRDVSGKGVRDTQKILEEYLPDLTSSLIGSVIVLGQGLPQRFTNNTPSGRKEVLEKLSKSDFMIEDIKDKLSKRKTELNEELRKVEDIILSSTSKKEILDNQLVKLKNDKALLACEADVDYDAEIKKYENSRYDLIVERDRKEYDRDLCKSRLDQKLQEYQDWVSKVHENYLFECSIIDENANIYQLSKENIELENKVKYKEDEIRKLESIKDICPTCGQHLPEVHKVDITPYKVELTNLKEMFEKHSEEFNVISATIEKAKKAIMDKFDKDTEKIKKEGQELRQFYDESVKIVNDLNKAINDIDIKIEAIKLNKQNYETKKDTIDKDIIDTENQIKQKDEEILYNNNEKNNIESRLQVVNKMITIATRDFRGFLLSEIIKYIDTKAKEYCLEVFGTDKINFVLDGNNISISYDGKEYENLSGGEKQRIDLIVQFSIRDMLCQFMNFSANLIALDEIYDALDVTSSQNVTNMISKKLSDIETVFIISHHLELDIPYDKQIFVVKNERGVSTIS